MACINPDGTLTQTAQKVLDALDAPAKDMEIAAHMSFPVYLVRSSLRELEKLGLIRETDGLYELTELGAAKR
jgi:predicted transcriptional regulator